MMMTLQARKEYRASYANLSYFPVDDSIQYTEILGDSDRHNYITVYIVYRRHFFLKHSETKASETSNI